MKLVSCKDHYYMEFILGEVREKRCPDYYMVIQDELIMLIYEEVNAKHLCVIYKLYPEGSEHAKETGHRCECWELEDYRGSEFEEFIHEKGIKWSMDIVPILKKHGFIEEKV